MRQRSRSGNTLGLGLTLGALLLVMSGCQTNPKTGAADGAGLGAIAGQAAGGDSDATLMGAGHGTGVGYVIGDEADKQKAREMSERSADADYAHDETGPLGGTQWRIVELTPDDVVLPYDSKIVDFRPDGFLFTKTTSEHGTETTTIERYRVVDDTLILYRQGFLINTLFDVEGDQLIVYADYFRAVLQRVR